MQSLVKRMWVVILVPLVLAVALLLVVASTGSASAQGTPGPRSFPNTANPPTPS